MLVICWSQPWLAERRKYRNRHPSAVTPQAGKTRVTIRLDDDILNWFRKQVDHQGGGNYQTLIIHALREHVEREREPLETTIRRVIREELRRAG
jgi:uncharacterized protein (DUF4415 family)